MQQCLPRVDLSAIYELYSTTETRGGRIWVHSVSGSRGLPEELSQVRLSFPKQADDGTISVKPWKCSSPPVPISDCIPFSGSDSRGFVFFLKHSRSILRVCGEVAHPNYPIVDHRTSISVFGEDFVRLFLGDEDRDERIMIDSNGDIFMSKTNVPIPGIAPVFLNDRGDIWYKINTSDTIGKVSDVFPGPRGIGFLTEDGRFFGSRRYDSRYFKILEDFFSIARRYDADMVRDIFEYRVRELGLNWRPIGTELMRSYLKGDYEQMRDDPGVPTEAKPSSEWFPNLDGTISALFNIDNYDDFGEYIMVCRDPNRKSGYACYFAQLFWGYEDAPRFTRVVQFAHELANIPNIVKVLRLGRYCYILDSDGTLWVCAKCGLCCQSGRHICTHKSSGQLFTAWDVVQVIEYEQPLCGMCKILEPPGFFGAFGPLVCDRGGGIFYVHPVVGYDNRFSLMRVGVTEPARVRYTKRAYRSPPVGEDTIPVPKSKTFVPNGAGNGGENNNKVVA